MNITNISIFIYMYYMHLYMRISYIFIYISSMYLYIYTQIYTPAWVTPLPERCSSSLRTTFSPPLRLGTTFGHILDCQGDLMTKLRQASRRFVTQDSQVHTFIIHRRVGMGFSVLRNGLPMLRNWHCFGSVSTNHSIQLSKPDKLVFFFSKKIIERRPSPETCKSPFPAFDVSGRRRRFSNETGHRDHRESG
jgi:hypothetical protein